MSGIWQNILENTTFSFFLFAVVVWVISFLHCAALLCYYTTDSFKNKPLSGNVESCMLIHVDSERPICFSLLDSTGGGTGEGEPRFLLPGLWPGSLPADQGWHCCGRSQRVHPTTTSNYHVWWRSASQAFRGPSQTNWHHIQSRFPPELSHI